MKMYEIYEKELEEGGGGGGRRRRRREKKVYLPLSNINSITNKANVNSY